MERMIALLKWQTWIFGALAALDWSWVVFSVDVKIDDAFVTALFVGVASLAGLIISARTLAVATKTKKLADQTHNEVKTMNALTVGAKSDADEKRRIEVLQEEGKPVTAAEAEHVHVMDDAAAKVEAAEKKAHPEEEDDDGS